MTDSSSLSINEKALLILKHDSFHVISKIFHVTSNIEPLLILPVKRPFSYSTKESGSSDIFIHFIHEARLNGVKASTFLFTFEILQNVMKYRSIRILF